MNKSKLFIILLVVALIASNIWSAYRTLDLGVTLTYQEASLKESQQALSQALAIIKVVGAKNGTRETIIGAAQNAWNAGEPFEKDGYLWVGRLGLRFNSNGHLIEAITG